MRENAFDKLSANDHVLDGVTGAIRDGTVAVDDPTLEVPAEQLRRCSLGPGGKDHHDGMINLDGRSVLAGAAASSTGATWGVDPVKLRLGIGYVIQSGGLMPRTSG